MLRRPQWLKGLTQAPIQYDVLQMKMEGVVAQDLRH